MIYPQNSGTIPLRGPGSLEIVHISLSPPHSSIPLLVPVGTDFNN
jgi:hypothetical protein